MEPLSLLNSFRQYLGNEAILWSPDVRKDVFEKKSGIKLTPTAQNMLEAIVTLLVSDIAWKEYNVFEKVVWALNGYVPRMDITELPPSYYIAYALEVMSKINNGEELSDEILKYIASILNEEGICLAVPPLEKAQEQLNRLVENTNFVEEIKKAWEISKDKLEEEPNIDDPISVQISRLKMIQLYLNRKRELNG